MSVRESPELGGLPERSESSGAGWRDVLKRARRFSWRGFLALWATRGWCLGALVVRSLLHQETVSDGARRQEMMQTVPGPALEVVEADFEFRLLVVPLDAPAELGEVRKAGNRRRFGQCTHTGAPRWPLPTLAGRCPFATWLRIAPRASDTARALQPTPEREPSRATQPQSDDRIAARGAELVADEDCAAVARDSGRHKQDGQLLRDVRHAAYALRHAV